MSLLDAVLAFAPLALVMTLTPGADTALVLRYAVADGRRTAMIAGLGVSLGVLIWGFAAAVGAAALLTAAPDALRVIKVAGGLYLLYLGVRMLLAARRGGGDVHGAQPAASVDGDARGEDARAFGTGLTTNLLNPKIGVFYLALIPQFHAEGLSPALVGTTLAAFHVAVGTAWFAVIATLAGRAAAATDRGTLARRMDVACGLVLVGFAVLVLTHA